MLVSMQWVLHLLSVYQHEARHATSVSYLFTEHNTPVFKAALAVMISYQYPPQMYFMHYMGSIIEMYIPSYIV